MPLMSQKQLALQEKTLTRIRKLQGAPGLCACQALPLKGLSPVLCKEKALSYLT